MKFSNQYNYWDIRYRLIEAGIEPESFSGKSLKEMVVMYFDLPRDNEA